MENSLKKGSPLEEIPARNTIQGSTQVRRIARVQYWRFVDDLGHSIAGGRIGRGGRFRDRGRWFIVHFLVGRGGSVGGSSCWREKNRKEIQQSERMNNSKQASRAKWLITPKTQQPLTFASDLFSFCRYRPTAPHWHCLASSRQIRSKFLRNLLFLSPLFRHRAVKSTSQRNFTKFQK